MLILTSHWTGKSVCSSNISTVGREKDWDWKRNCPGLLFNPDQTSPPQPPAPINAGMGAGAWSNGLKTHLSLSLTLVFVYRAAHSGQPTGIFLSELPISSLISSRSKLKENYWQSGSVFLITRANKLFTEQVFYELESACYLHDTHKT